MNEITKSPREIYACSFTKMLFDNAKALVGIVGKSNFLQNVSVVRSYV